MESKTEHILMVPFMAQGHLQPFMELAIRLETRTQFTITLLSTPLNAQFLRKQLSNHHCSTIKIVDLPFNSSDHGLPPAIENTSKLPLTLFSSLLHASTSLETHVENFIKNNFTLINPPLCIIFDVFYGWCNRVARNVGSTGIAFTTCGAYGTAAYVSIWNELPHQNLLDNENFSLPGFPKTHKFNRAHLHRFIRYANGNDDWSRYFQPQIRQSMKSFGWLCNSIEGIEPIGFEILRNYIKLPVWGIGPLISSPVEKSSSNKNACIEWLNLKEPDSVLYISFGSQNTIAQTQMMELAKGLEQSGKPFLWVIRPPFGFDINGEFKPEWLPNGFEERTKERKQGILVHKWGPQLEILRHESIGGFLTHCGWNSVLESLREGVPLLGWPLAGEQAYNLKLLNEEMGVAMELARGLEDEVSKEKVKRSVEMVLERKEGSRGWEMKNRALEMGKKIKDCVRDETEYKGSSVHAIDDFLDTIINARNNLVVQDQ